MLSAKSFANSVSRINCTCVYVRDICDLRSLYLHRCKFRAKRISNAVEERTMRWHGDVKKVGLPGSMCTCFCEHVLHSFDRTGNYDLSRRIDVSHETGNWSECTDATRSLTCLSLRSTIAAKPYPVGYRCSICSARERTNLTALDKLIDSAMTAAEKAPANIPATAEQLRPFLCNALVEQPQLEPVRFGPRLWIG